MGNIHLDVLDAYTKRLTDKQVGKLYESKMHKTYTKKLNEEAIMSNSDYQLYLHEYTIAMEVNANKTDFMMAMYENYESLLNELTYRVDSNAVLFSTPDKTKYRNLLESLQELGFNSETLVSIRDEKY